MNLQKIALVWNWGRLTRMNYRDEMKTNPLITNWPVEDMMKWGSTIPIIMSQILPTRIGKHSIDFYNHFSILNNFFFIFAGLFGDLPLWYRLSHRFAIEYVSGLIPKKVVLPMILFASVLILCNNIFIVNLVDS